MTIELQPLTNQKKPNGPVVLIILDGVGIGEKNEANAVYQAKTPFLDSLQKATIYTELKAHGTAVGMPTDSDMGNSEVGHNAIGAGRVFPQGSSLVKNAIQSKKIFESKTWNEGLAYCRNHTLHFIGLLSDGNVHNHIDYQLALFKEAAKQQKKIRLHLLLDGRDVEARSALQYLSTLNTVIATLQSEGVDIKIASGGGRMITTMDRYNADWSIVERGWNAHVLGKAASYTKAEDAIKAAYDSDDSLNDQYIPPFVITENDIPVGTIEDGDTVFLSNFRGDRAIEISEAFEKEQFDHFDRIRQPKIYFAGMMQYDGDLNIPNNFLVHPPQINHTISEFLCNASLNTFAISETQKYGHVTYFWNGNNSSMFNESLETYIEIPSDTIPFDQAPAMKAKEITEATIQLLDSKKYQFGRINFPNGDMVGHTGNFDATVYTMETIDHYTELLVRKIQSLNGIAVIVADHGNADEMYTVKNSVKVPKTSHTLAPVPFAILDSNTTVNYTLNDNINEPGLANIAATLCNLLGYKAPEIYNDSLIQFD